jgi:CRISPR-associated endoribonuclease Cas6
MRCLITLQARQDFAYSNQYNHKLQGRLYQDLNERGHDQLHEDHGPKLFSFSNLFPPRDASKGDTRRLLFASVDADLVTDVAYGFCSKPEVNIGEMPLETQEAITLDPTVEERGELTTGTPIVIRMTADEAADYGIDSDYDRVYWRPEHGMDVFFDRLYQNLQRKYEKYYDETPPEPPYFTGYSLDRPVTKPVDYPDGDVTYIGAEWTFEYELDGPKHRKLLNLALDAGLGELNALGFGFINRGEDV